MSPIYSLAEITDDLRGVVGEKAYYLAQLKHQGLPVVDGQVIAVTVGQQWLQQMDWLAPAARTDHSSSVPSPQRCQQWRQHLRQVPLPELPAPSGSTPWLMRASLVPPDLAHPPPRLWLSGLLPAQGYCDAVTLDRAYRWLWDQVLSVGLLTVLAHWRLAPQQVALAALCQPLQGASVSGTLVLAGDQAQVEVVQGLGLSQVRGEAVPARCRFTLPYQPTVGGDSWLPGYQDRVWGLGAVARAGEAAVVLSRSAPVRPPVVPPWGYNDVVALGQTQGSFTAPLSPVQVQTLLSLALQVRQILGLPTLRLEWLYRAADGACLITQAEPWPSPDSPPAPAPAPLETAPPALPTISLVVKGLSAAAGRVMAPALTATAAADLPQPLPPGRVVVLSDLQPDGFVQLQGAAGIITEQGGATCHAAILARELGIPAMVGAPQATQLIASDDLVWLDGERSLAYVVDQDAPLPVPPWPQASPPSPARSLPLETRTQVMVNLSQPSQLSRLPVDQMAGVGLLRSEWLLLEILEGRHPQHWLEAGQGAALQQRWHTQLLAMVAAFAPKPVRYRALDLRSHEWQTLIGSPPPEPNPMLGLRGTLSYGLSDDLFKLELAVLAAVQQAGYANLHLILPFVRTVEEVVACQQQIRAQGVDQGQGFELWIMAEVPSVLFLLPAYAQAGVQGIAIGSNDLTQLLLAIDRDQPLLASAYDERHPVVHQALRHLVQQAKQAGLQCSICGQAPVRHPDLIPQLVQWGIDSISVETAAFRQTQQRVWASEQQIE